MPINLLSAGGGTTTITTASSASNFTVTLPASTGTFVTTAPGTAGNVLTSSGSAWTSAAPAAPTAPFTGQTYADYAGSRSPGTTYTNSTGKAICIWVGWQNANSRYCQLIVGGNIASQFYGNNYSWGYGFAIVPNGATYSSNANGQTVTYWYELR
jgi:hypothetical protein